jgi:hypothetical protein
MFQVLQAFETGDTHDDVSHCHLVDKYQSFYRNYCLHCQCRISQTLILILKMINFTTHCWWLQTDFFRFCNIGRDGLSHRYVQSDIHLHRCEKH